ncbi:MAG: DEAD/DEAH box helicase [Phycisphaerae bacterium]|nr:DEAD/DEAH box helicase [Phycisphaerae bacterium]
MSSLLMPSIASGLTLRDYQAEAVQSVYNHLRFRDDNPCIVLPTGSGKTPVMATICRDAVQKWQGRVLILAHVKELLEQTAQMLQRVAPDLNVGVYSAGLNARDTHQPIIVAGIQSIYRRAHKFDPFDLVLVDESHLIPFSGEGMYRTFLEDARKLNPHIRVIGLTATPYRLKGGVICRPDHFLNSICHEVGVRKLIDDGYLCPLRSKAGKAKANLDNLHIRGGEFIASEVEAAMDNYQLVEEACQEIVEQTPDRHSVLLFTAGVAHGQHVSRTIQRIADQECGFVYGETPPLQRELTIQRFKNGNLKYLANVNVLTTGFDAPNVDTVALLRPTNSVGLYYQMVGRGFRLHPDKQDCLVLDYGSNILRHGPIDALEIKDTIGPTGQAAPQKECPECQEIVHAACKVCPDCGYVFPIEESPRHDRKATTKEILSPDTTDTSYAVEGVQYYVHHKLNAPPEAPTTMRVEYQVGLGDYKREWVCIEHTGFARDKAENWWRKRSSEPMPNTTAEAIELANSGVLAEPDRIVVRKTLGKTFPEIIRYDLGAIPPRLDGSEERENDQPDDPHTWIDDDDEIPF